LTTGGAADGVYDGELIAGSFAEVVTILSAKPGSVDVKPLRFAVWDYLTLEEADSESCSRLCAERTGQLRLSLKGVTSNRVVVVSGIEVWDEASIQSAFEHYVREGFEGIVIKSLDGPYSFGAGNDWQRLKPAQTTDLEVVEVVEGKGRFANLAGTIVVAGEILIGQARRHFRGRVSSGLTLDDREFYWASRNRLAGLVAEVRIQAGPEGARFAPVFVRRRDDLALPAFAQ